MNPLNRQWFYKGFRKQLISSLSPDKAAIIWEDAGKEYTRILAADPALKEHKGAMTLPAVALYRVLTASGEDAEALLNTYGDCMGEKFARFVHTMTCFPGVSKLLWKRIDKTMDRMSGEAKGYKRRIVSDPPEMYGVDILSCPYHEFAKQLGTEKAVLCICHMDKAYMKGFHHIRYERTTAVSEGAECCDYRLRYDPEKE
ncbi:MAG: L-2-amino-thiazoline-4-carboxylic acid hydrolase [Oscillospiraceae bacterium]|nr:L-2-amino-thiazoline-4-carboxylic acid hydrolase [Oscillospiraceae bacterium]